MAVHCTWVRSRSPKLCHWAVNSQGWTDEEDGPRDQAGGGHHHGEHGDGHGLGRQQAGAAGGNGEDVAEGPEASTTSRA